MQEKPGQLKMDDAEVLKFTEAREYQGECGGCNESCCSICCCCCCRPAFAEDHAVAECSGVCCYKWLALFPCVGYACCSFACTRCCRCGPCRPYVPFTEWTCCFHTVLGGMKALVEKAPMENVYAVQALTDTPMPFCAWPCGVRKKRVKATVEGPKGLAKVRAEWMSPSTASEDGEVILYFHGGAFVYVSAAAERFHTGLLAKYLGRRILSCEYPRPPKSPWPEPIDSALNSWIWLTTVAKVDPSKVILSGDSAGGNIAISLMRRLHERGEKPGGLMLFSPWVEMVPFPSVSWECNKNYDYIANKPVLHLLVDLYTDQKDPRDKDVSPLRADVAEFQNWPPVWISIGGAEVLRTSIEAFAAKLKEAQVTTEVYTGRGMPHVFQLFAQFTRPPKAEYLPCALRCMGCGCCCPNASQEHPTWKSLAEAGSFLDKLSGGDLESGV